MEYLSRELLDDMRHCIEQYGFLAMLTPDGVIKHINKKWCWQLGVAHDEVIETHLFQWLATEHTTAFLTQDYEDALAQGVPWIGELCFVSKHGNPFWLKLTIKPVTNTLGQIHHCVVIGDNISEQKQIEHGLIQAREAALEATRVKSVFLANMSHEIRTPLNGVLGMAQLLQKTALTAEQQTYLGVLSQSASALMELLNDILDFSKIEAGKLALSPEPCAIRELVTDVVALFAHRAAEKNIELLCWVHPSVPACIQADPLRVKQILLNLVGNAIKFTDSGEVMVGVSVAEQVGDKLTLSIWVSDTGVGLTPEQQAIIFDPFRQADGATSRQFGGTGLGLSIIKQLIDLMHGTLTVKSQKDAGSTFTVTFPTQLHLAPSDLTQTCPIFAGQTVYMSLDSVPLETFASAVMLQCGLRTLPLPPDAADWPANGSAIVVGYPSFVRYQAALEAFQAHGGCVFLLASHTDISQLTQMDWLLPERRFIKPLDAMAFLQQLSLWFHRVDAGGTVLTAPDDAPAMPAQMVLLPRQAHVAGNAAASLQGKRILLAEDNEINQLVVRSFLEQAGATVLSALDGQEAIDLWASQPVDLILMDLQMPFMDGLTATRHIRAQTGPEAQVCILALTANVFAEEQAACSAAGMDAILLKPIQEAELIDAIQHHLQATSQA